MNSTNSININYPSQGFFPFKNDGMNNSTNNFNNNISLNRSISNNIGSCSSIIKSPPIQDVRFHFGINSDPALPENNTNNF